jgi:uncharacterized membrane protein YjgN (DUF898 family)
MSDVTLGVGSGPSGDATEQTSPIRAEYSYEGPTLFWMVLRMALLTVVTLGLYRFWMTTRLRRYYWNAVRIMGDPVEYTGTGLEKLLGFLLALVILAVYLTIVNLGLAFLGLSNLDDPVQLQIIFNLSLLATLPLIFFATYRAWRYIMSRTRWRGIRFGMDQAAWAYTGRALLLTLLTGLTLGLLYPYQHFKLTKFMVDRSWFGSQRFHQDGRWQELLGYWIWVYLIFAFVAAGLIGVAIDPTNPVFLGMTGTGVFFGYIGVFVLMMRYQIASFRYLWDNRTLGGARFRNDTDTAEYIGITIGGSMGAVTCAMFIAFFLVFMIVIAVLIGIGSLGGLDQILAAIESGDDPEFNPMLMWPLTVGLVSGYLLTFVLSFAFTHIFVTRPILRRKVEGMQIAGAESLAAAEQRAHDDAVEAGGFADALGVDIGAGV